VNKSNSFVSRNNKLSPISDNIFGHFLSDWKNSKIPKSLEKMKRALFPHPLKHFLLRVSEKFNLVTRSSF
jgi:hypothetical protein